MCLAQGTRDGCGGGEVEMVFVLPGNVFSGGYMGLIVCLVWGRAPVCSNSDIEEIVKLVILVPVRDVLGIYSAGPTITRNHSLDSKLVASPPADRRYFSVPPFNKKTLQATNLLNIISGFDCWRREDPRGIQGVCRNRWDVVH